jgi:hypothetical protein
LLHDSVLSHQLGQAGRQLVQRDGSLETMVHGYEDLIETIYASKTATGLLSESHTTGAIQ